MTLPPSPAAILPPVLQQPFLWMSIFGNYHLKDNKETRTEVVLGHLIYLFGPQA